MCPMEMGNASRITRPNGFEKTLRSAGSVQKTQLMGGGDWVATIFFDIRKIVTYILMDAPI